MGDFDIKAVQSASETRSLHMRKLLNLADEVDLLYQEFNNQKIKGNGMSFVGGKQYHPLFRSTFEKKAIESLQNNVLIVVSNEDCTLA